MISVRPGRAWCRPRVGPSVSARITSVVCASGKPATIVWKPGGDAAVTDATARIEGADAVRDGVTLWMRVGDGGCRRNARMRQANWCQDVPVDVIGQTLPADLFDRQSEQDGVGVAVVKLCAGWGLQGLVQRDLRTGRHTRNQLRDRVVAPRPPLIDQHQQRGDGESLCRTADTGVNIGSHRAPEALSATPNARTYSPSGPETPTIAPAMDGSDRTPFDYSVEALGARQGDGRGCCCRCGGRAGVRRGDRDRRDQRAGPR